MRKPFRYMLAAVVALLTLASCGKDDMEPAEGSACPTFSVAINGAHTRAIDDFWENGDRVGVSGSSSINVCHVCQVGIEDATLMAENPDQKIYFLDSNSFEFTAYYPYNSDRDANTGLINNISTADQANQKNFDFLWASGEGSKRNPKVNFNFTHRMSKISFVFKNGKNMDVSAINRLRLNGLVVEGTFDTTTGICGVSETMPTESTSVTLTGVTEEEPVTPLFLFPQTVGGPLKLEIYDSQSQYFVCNINVPDNTLEAGTNYTYTITVSKTGLSVTGGTISEWIEDEVKSSASSADE